MALYDADRIRWAMYYPATGAVLTNPSFEIAETSGGVDYSNLPASWIVTGAAAEWAAAEFGPPLRWTETFEALWGDNQDALSAFSAGDLDAAVFGATPQTVYESFESQWGGNEDALEAWDDSYSDPAVFDAAALEYEDFEQEWPSRHPVADTRWITPDISDAGAAAALYTQLNLIKATFNLHIADAAVHVAADVTNPITALDASDLASAETLADELWEDCWAHILDVGAAWHLPYTTGSIDKPDETAIYHASGLADCADIANYVTVYLDLHFTWASSAAFGYRDSFPDTAPTDLTEWWGIPATFNVAGEEFEDFEKEWGDNENALASFAPGDISIFDIIGDGGPFAFESFEHLQAMNIVLVATSPGTLLDISPSHGIRIAFAGTLTGDLRLQARSTTGGEWLELDAVTTVPVDVDVDSGYKQLRIYTEAYAAGAPTATMIWRPLATM